MVLTQTGRHAAGTLAHRFPARDPMTRFIRPTLLLLTLALGACDAVGAGDEVSAEDLYDAAVVVASAVALDAGGVLEDAAAGASFALAADASGRTAGPGRPGCDNARTFDADATLWTVTIDCERGDPEGRFYASFERVATYRFVDAAGAAQERPAGAASLDYDVLSGTSLFRSPHGVHALTALGADLSVTDLDQDLVTVNGSYQRAATDTLRGPGGERTVAYDLALTLDDVQGPKGTARRWRSAVGGTITGTLHATITRTPVGGPSTQRTVDQEFTITFPADGSGDRVAQIALGGHRYRADVETGEIDGL